MTVVEIPPCHIHRRMQAVCGDKCVGVITVRRRVWQFEQEEAREASLCYKERSGRPGRNSESC